MKDRPMPIVEFHIAEGRSPELKQELCSAVTEAIVRILDVPEDNVRIIIREIAIENFSVAGTTFFTKGRTGSA